MWNALYARMPTLGTSSLPMYLHETDYCDLFPKEQIVLLSPHSPNLLKEYDASKHYVLGGYVKRGRDVPLLMTKAKQLELTTARIPFEAYRSMQRHHNTMPMDRLIRILLDVKCGLGWDKAFNHVPSRFLK